MPSRQYAITQEAVAAERSRVGDDLSKVDVAREIALDTVELRDVGRLDGGSTASHGGAIYRDTT